MNVLELFRSFQTDEQAIDHLEATRWREHPVCPYCDSELVGRHASGDRANQRWQCRHCTRAFSVTVGTIFHGTHMPLRKWFMVLAPNAQCEKERERLPDFARSWHQTTDRLEHDASHPKAMAAMQLKQPLLHGIVEADETYVGGKPRKGNKGATMTTLRVKARTGEPKKWPWSG